MSEALSPDTIREGFLCPVCHRDLRSPHLLLTHFETSHSEEQDLLRSIKGRLCCDLYKFTPLTIHSI